MGTAPAITTMGIARGTVTIMGIAPGAVTIAVGSNDDLQCIALFGRRFWIGANVWYAFLGSHKIRLTLANRRVASCSPIHKLV